MILTASIAKTGVRRLREIIQEQTGVKLLYSANVKDIRRHSLHFRYGFSLPLPADIAHKETERNKPEDIVFLKEKKTFTDFVSANGFLAPTFKKELPTAEDYPVIVRTTLNSFGGRGMSIARNEQEFVEQWSPSYWWCKYIPTVEEYRFHIGNPLEGNPQILRVMKKVPRTEEIASKDVHIRHVDEYHYSKRYNPAEKFPKWCEEILDLTNILSGWLYSLDVGVTPDRQLVYFEANTASGIDNGCARDYAKFIIPELGL